MHVLSRLVGKESEILLERRCETGLVLVSHGVSNLTYRHTPASKQFQRVSHATFRAVVEHRDAEPCFEGTLEL